jgi:hypothetical protein
MRFKLPAFAPAWYGSRGERLQALVAACAEMTGPLHLGGRMNFNTKSTDQLDYTLDGIYRAKELCIELHASAEMYCPWHFGIGGDHGFGLLLENDHNHNQKQKNKTRGLFSACDRTTAASTSSINVLSIT